MSGHVASAEDLAFRAAFEACTFPATEFNHRAHLRLAYVCLCEAGVDDTVVRIRTGIERLLRHLGVDPAAKYHETLTRAWVLAVHRGMSKAAPAGSAEAFLAGCPELLDQRIMTRHYTTARLQSPEARTGFLEPDLQPLQ